jgi:hypothetical protein
MDKDLRDLEIWLLSNDGKEAIVKVLSGKSLIDSIIEDMRNIDNDIVFNI